MMSYHPLLRKLRNRRQRRADWLSGDAIANGSMFLTDVPGYFPSFLLTVEQGWVVTSFTPTINQGLDPGSGAAGMIWRGTAVLNSFQWFYDGGGLLNMNVRRITEASGFGVALSLPYNYQAGVPTRAAYAWDIGNLYVGKDGAALLSAVNANLPPITQSIRMGYNYAGPGYNPGVYHWIAFGIGPLSNANWAAINAFGVVTPDLSALPLATNARGVWDAVTKELRT